MTKTNGISDSFEARIGSLKDSVRDLADLGTTRAGELKDRVVVAKQHALSSADKFLSTTKSWISENPLTSVGIAFGIGYIAMRIVRR